MQQQFPLHPHVSALPPKKAARILNVSIHTLKKWRMQGLGPRFVKQGRIIRYPMEGLLEWANGGGE